MNKESVSAKVESVDQRGEPQREELEIPFLQKNHIVARSVWEAEALMASNKDARRFGRIILWPKSIAA